MTETTNQSLVDFRAGREDAREREAEALEEAEFWRTVYEMAAED